MNKEDKSLCLLGICLLIFDICLCGGIQYLQNLQNEPSVPATVQDKQDEPQPLFSPIDVTKLLTVAPPEPVNLLDPSPSQTGPTGMSNSNYLIHYRKVGENYIELTTDQKGNRINRRLLGPDFKPIDTTEVAPATSKSQSLPNH